MQLQGKTQLILVSFRKLKHTIGNQRDLQEEVSNTTSLPIAVRRLTMNFLFLSQNDNCTEKHISNGKR